MARETGTKVVTIRYYEQIGSTFKQLLSGQRNYRRLPDHRGVVAAQRSKLLKHLTKGIVSQLRGSALIGVHLRSSAASYAFSVALREQGYQTRINAVLRTYMEAHKS